MSRIATPRGVEVGCPGGVDGGGHVGEEEAEALVVDDLAAERGSFVCVVDGGVECCLCEAGGDGRDAESAGIQCGEGDLESLALGAESTSLLDEGVVVVRRGGGDRREAHLLLGFAEREAGGVAGDEEARDALGAFVCAGEQVVDIRDATVGDPRLGAGDGVSALGGRSFAVECGGVGSCLRLRQAVRADQPALQQIREPLLLLLVGAEGEQGVAGEAVHAGRDGNGRPPRAEFFEHLQVHLVGLAAASPLLGIGQTEQSCLAHLGEEAVGIPLGLFVLVDDGEELLVGEVPGQRDQITSLVGGQETVDGHESSDGA